MFCQVVRRERQEFKELNLYLAWVCSSITLTQSSSRNSLSLMKGSNREKETTFLFVVVVVFSLRNYDSQHNNIFYLL